MLLNESELNGHPWITISFLSCCDFVGLWSGAIAFPGIMYAAGRLGSYITQGVYTVSGPFHPFGGAVDIVVVEQQDGTFKSSPWNVRFGKFQGVLKAKEKVVSINVNGVDAGFHMYLDHKGEAYFLRIVEEEGVAVADMYPSSSGDETDVKSSIWRQEKSKSCNYDARRTDLDSKIEASDRKTTARASSQKSKVFGLVFGCTPVKENGFQEEEEQGIGVRMDSLERAEIAADLLEVRWSTSLATRKKWKNDKRSLDQRKSVCGVDRKSRIKDIGYSESLNTNEELGVQSYELPQVLSPTSQGRYMETFILEETYMETLYGRDIESQTSSSIANVANNDNRPDMVKVSDILDYALDISHSEELEVTSGRLAEEGTLTDVFSSVNCESVESIRGEFHESVGHADEILLADSLVAGKPIGHDEALKELRESIAKVNLGSLTGIAAVEVGTNTDIQSTNCVDGEATGLGIRSQIGGTETGTELDISDQSRVIEECALDHHLEETKNKDSSGQRLNFIKSSCKLGSCCTVFGSITEVQTLDPCTAAYPLGSLHLASYDDSFCSSLMNHLPSLTAENSVLKSKLDIESSDNSQEEKFLLSGLDHPTHSKSTSWNSMGKVDNPQDFMESSEEKVNESTSKENGLQSLIDKSIEEGQLNGHRSPVEKSSQISSAIGIQYVSREPDQESPLLRVEPFPTLQSLVSDLSAPDIHHSLSQSLDSTLESSRLVKNSVSLSSDIAVEETRHAASEHYTFEELKMIFSDPAVEVSLCRHLLYEGMGYEAAGRAFDAEKMDMDKFTCRAPDIIKNERLVVRIGGLYFPWDAALSIASARGSNGKDLILEPKGMIVVDQAGNILGDPQKSVDTRKGTWRFWPFSLRRSISMQSRSSDLDNASMSPRGVLGGADLPKPAVTRKTVRGKTPTSEQLASLNLKEGKNVVTFTFSTPMLGKQQVDARIYLWKWSTRIVVSDVDGTITKSDVLGHFMPLVGIDWSHTGVAHLFSAIKENGYQLLFLSARAISQACNTRQFLFNLKQDGKALPDGPVVISPDGLFPSLYREVIRRAPHEFKISCLEEIKALFPRDSNPFYAGFGNRDTDEISYLKVGIPRGKIFTINPRGEIAVNRQVDTKSYTSLHALVHDMFPPASSTEQEDFNSWNFWRLPPPDMSGF